MELTPLQPWIARQIDRPALSLADLRRYQLEKLQKTLALARSRSRFYRRHLDQAPPTLNNLADLCRFPLTTAEDIRRDPLAFVTVSQGEIARVVTLDTSGTTGPPKRLYFTRSDQALTIDFFHIGMSTFTGAGDRVLILLPGERAGSVGDLLATALARLGAVGLKHGPVRNIADTLAVMRREGVTGLVGIPVQVLALARSQQQPLRLKSVLLTTDHVPQAIVRAVERAWNCPVYNHYGMTEMGLGGGVECRARRGYHLREADLYFEIVDPATGLPLPPGQPGEIVFTTLTRRGMPLIRYRTGDISRFLPGDCPCGAVLPRLERVRARLAGYIPLGESHYLTMADLDEALFSIEGLLDFSATIRPKQDGLLLSLELTFNTDGPQSGLDQAVRTIPAVQAGRLELSITVRPGTVTQLSNPGKRFIYRGVRGR